ncbi:MAG: hypothetical protein ACNYWM_05640 [Methanosarcinales archaeon]
MKNKRIQLGAVLAVMLVISMAFVPVMSAKTELSNVDNNDAIDLTSNIPISEKNIENLQENIIILSQTDKEKIVSFEKEDGSIIYTISWLDETNKRVNFAFINQKELIARQKLNSKDLNDNILVTSVISAEKEDFWNGSYAELYGNKITGGIYIYFSPKDAGLIKDAGLLASGAIAIVIASIDGPIPISDPVAGLIGIGLAAIVVAFYWLESNDDGSLDVKIPYSNVITVILGHVKIKLGSHWYTYTL